VIFRREGVTLIEIIVVLVIIGLAVRFLLPNFTTPNEQAWAINARNNLLAIYTAQQNYNVNNGGYCLIAGTCGDTLPDLNLHLSLSIQDDGTYTYTCPTASTCTATRANASFLPLITVTLNTPIQLNSANPSPNPTCVAAVGQNGWCP
jgi:prepilin-type N-terminal cleavage/methylation domain-containing protein